jgi:hypothetical protein
MLRMSIRYAQNTRLIHMTAGSKRKYNSVDMLGIEYFETEVGRQMVGVVDAAMSPGVVCATI